jgi:hypothetical protein
VPGRLYPWVSVLRSQLDFFPWGHSAAKASAFAADLWAIRLSSRSLEPRAFSRRSAHCRLCVPLLPPRR